ncbi:MAG TPA: hypothetical protein VHF92_02855, partial [Geodermatophilus sp.]|nr:hypothetical protein [Geodermatophilus sp.]
WVAGTVGGALVGLLVVWFTPATYEASARVFVSVSPSIPNSATFVTQRVKSYPDVVVSESVLGPVVEELELEEPVRELRSRISATNPPDTSQLEITAAGRDPEQAAAIANAVAERLTTVVQELETPASGDRPVTLTVTDPAAVPRTPVSPVLLYVVGLGLLVGLFLGLAGAITRDRFDTSVHTEDDVRRAWGEDEDVVVLVQRSGRAGRSALTGRPATALALRLEAAAEERSLRAVLICPAPAEHAAPAALAEELAAVLRDRGVTAGSDAGDGPRVLLEVADPLAPLRVWRERAERGDAVALVVPAGRVDRAELREIRGVLRAAGVRPTAVVLLPRSPRPPAPSPDPAPDAAPVPAVAPAAVDAEPADRPLEPVDAMAGAARKPSPQPRGH